MIKHRQHHFAQCYAVICQQAQNAKGIRKQAAARGRVEQGPKLQQVTGGIRGAVQVRGHGAHACRHGRTRKLGGINPHATPWHHRITAHKPAANMRVNSIVKLSVKLGFTHCQPTEQNRFDNQHPRILGQINP